jgi:HPt (histidine-containing phosphotransfer) domain-containing protein
MPASLTGSYRLWFISFGNNKLTGMVPMAPEFSRRFKKFNSDPAADPKVLDLAHLARYTIGNRELEEELLRLFRAQLRAQATAILEAKTGEAWRFATHTLKGVARSIGAVAIAETAERLEQFGHAGDVGKRNRLLETLEARIAACEREIERIIGSPPTP